MHRPINDKPTNNITTRQRTTRITTLQQTQRHRQHQYQQQQQQPSARPSGKPSRVIHIRNIPNESSEAEVIQLGVPFGRVTNVLVLKGKNQAFLEMADEVSAAAMVACFNNNPPQVRGRTVYVQFSNHRELKTDQSHSVAVSISEICFSMNFRFSSIVFILLFVLYRSFEYDFGSGKFFHFFLHSVGIDCLLICRNSIESISHAHYVSSLALNHIERQSMLTDRWQRLCQRYQTSFMDKM